MAVQGLFTGDVQIRNLNGMLIATDGLVSATSIPSSTSGTSGTSGISGTSGVSGTSGTSGISGTSGTSGLNGTSGTSGINGTSGISGTSGVNGTSGVSGTSGTSGLAGTSGTSGSMGAAGTSGLSGTSGTSGSTFGTSGTSGTSGQNGISAGRTYYFNQSQSSDVSPYKVLSLEPSGAAQQTVTKTLTNNQQNVLVSSFLTPELGFSVIPSGVQRFHSHYLKQASNDQIQTYVTIELANAAGTGYGTILSTSSAEIGWVNNVTPVETTVDLTLPTTTINTTDRMIVKIYVSNNDSTTHNVTWYTEGISYYSFVLTSVGALGGTSGTSGINGTSGISGTSGTSGINGTSGTSGANGSAGTPGANGTSGTSGANGSPGTPGANGTSGTSGANGAPGTPGTPGANGTSGTSPSAAAYVPYSGAISSLNMNGYSITAAAFYEGSDIRFKKVIESNPSVDNIDNIEVIKFTRTDVDLDKVRFGYSAQQVQSILPEAVVGEEKLVVNYSDVHTLKIASLEKRIAELEAKLNL